jgi:hypothetical protein
MQLKPLVTCSYGWKRTFALYQDRINVDGTVYSLDDLVHVRSVYRTVLSIPSIRLELHFRKKNVVLRGIAAIEDVKRVVEYLDTYCADARRVTARLRWSRKRPAVTLEQHVDTPSTPEAIEALPEPRRPQRSPLHVGETRYVGETLAVSLVPLKDEAPIKELQKSHKQKQTEALPEDTPIWLQDLEQHVIYTRQQRSTQMNRSLRRYGVDVQALAHHAEAETLPSVSVPLRLLPHEQAHYCTNATLCNETPVAPQRVTYTTADHGKLILTNKRVVYLGRTGQIVLDYAQLTHVARLHNSIVFSADSWSVRYKFEVQRPLECAMHLDSILRQFQRKVERQRFSEFEPTLRELYAHSTRTTQPRYATRSTITMRHVKPAIELADVETLPLSLLNSVDMEVVE